jgi:hypothetical protein
MFGHRSTTAVEDPPDADVVQERRVHTTTTSAWSPAQVVGFVLGIGFVVLGITAVVQTGFDTSHIYRPHEIVWHLPHSPLLAVCEIAWGVLMVIASAVPGGARGAMALLSAISLALGVVVLVQSLPNRLNHWLAVTNRSGWFFLGVGIVGLLAALFSPTFGRAVRTTREHSRVHDAV